MKKALVTGGAGFIGSHLVDWLLEDGWEVWAVDNFITGSPKNIEHLKKNQDFVFVEVDVSQPLPSKVTGEKFDFIFHLASPASPKGYNDYPLETILVNSQGTYNLLELCKATGAPFLFASTSEVYGEPEVHPQPETYRGNVNPIGPRACYDESKRLGESMTMVYHNKYKVDTRIVRIFNTYGPRMQNEDGRVIPNFITQSLKRQNITIYGDGTQTRSFCYVSDLVEGIVLAALKEGTNGEVINLGNPREIDMNSLAKIIKKLTGSSSNMVYKPRPEDDPTRRKPDIEKARKLLGWEAKIPLEEGLVKTIEYFKNLDESSSSHSHL